MTNGDASGAPPVADILKRSWPTANLRLLLMAYTAPIDRAFEAWREWAETADIDQCGWAEMRLLAAVANRIAVLDPTSPLRPTIEGIRRFVFARNQMRAKASMPAIDALLSVEIPVMLLKGAARLATNPLNMSSRYLRDFDLLVTRAEMARATDALLASGFRPTNGDLPGVVRAAAFDREYRDADDTPVRPEIDLHWSALRFGRLGDHDGPLMSRGRSVRFLGRDVLVPSPADQLIIALAHGAVADSDRPCDWVIDSVETVREGDCDWTIFTEEVRARRLEIPVASGLAFLCDELGVSLNGDVRKTLSSAASSRLFEREFVSEATDRSRRGPIARVSSFAAERIRSVGRGRTRPPSTPSVAVRPLVGKWPPVGWTALSFVDPVPLPANALRSPLRLGLDLSKRPGRLELDLLIDRRWVARIKIRKRNRVAGRGKRFLVRITLPERWRGLSAKTLQLIALDDQRRSAKPEGASAYLCLPQVA